MWATFASLFYASKFNAERPMTRKAYEEQKRVNKGGKPKEPSAEEWRSQEELAKFHDEMLDRGIKAALAPYHFEEVMLFREHLFEEPPEPELKSAEELRREEIERSRQFVEESKAYLLEHSSFARAARKKV